MMNMLNMMKKMSTERKYEYSSKKRGNYDHGKKIEHAQK